MPPRQTSREESWNSLHRSEASEDVSDGFSYSDASMDGDSEREVSESATASSNFPTINDVHRALHPLQATAERVGRQVERFAETLDRLSRRNDQPPHDCRQVLPTINAYLEIARDTVHHLQTLHAPERRQRLVREKRRQSCNSKSHSPADTSKDQDAMTTIEDLERWQQEQQTWDLLGLTLQGEKPIPSRERVVTTQGDQGLRPTGHKEVHQYSPEKDVWDNYLASDDEAWERYAIVEWLKRCADHSGQDIEHVVEHLESDADRGSGLWAHSWLYTKEAIKGQKRLRSWPRALEPDDPGLDSSLTNSERTKTLVTQLDPDAITRQDRILEKQDYYHERAIWLACWEMLRRGKDWEFIHEWCHERVETWRATTFRGDLRISRDAHWQSQCLWRKACALAAKDGGTDEYEKAVYGVLSGHLASVEQVSHSWNDFLFAHYNAALLHGYDQFIKLNFAQRLPRSLGNQRGTFCYSVHAEQHPHTGKQLVERMLELEFSKQEALESIKMLQGSLIAHNFDEFVVKQGIRLTQSAKTQSQSKILRPLNNGLTAEVATTHITMQDHDLLRILTHIIFIYQDLGHDFGDNDRLFAVESIVVAYIDYLSKAGKQQLLPLYASRLSTQRSMTCLARQLPSIQHRDERQTMMRLMHRAGINVPGVLGMQLQMIVEDTPPKEATSLSDYRLDILEKASGEGSTIRQIKSQFLGRHILNDQEDLVRAFEWFQLLEGHWQQTMTVGTVVYKHFFRTNALAAAKLMSETVTFAQISLSKSHGILGRIIDVSKDDESSDEERGLGSRAHKLKPHHHRGYSSERSPSAQRRIDERKLLLHQATTFRDFEKLVNALSALEVWKGAADEAARSTDPQAVKMIKGPLQVAYQKVEDTVEPLLNGWLQHPKNDSEAAEFEGFRRACLPEIVLAYNAVLNFSSHYLRRDLLLKSMDLAANIAAQGSDVAACFVEAGRMPELVDSFAWSGKNMIRADDSRARSGKTKKRKDGETLDLWTVRAPN